MLGALQPTLCKYFGMCGLHWILLCQQKTQHLVAFCDTGSLDHFHPIQFSAQNRNIVSLHKNTKGWKVIDAYCSEDKHKYFHFQG